MGQVESIIEEGSAIMKACIESTKKSFNVTELKPEHIACVNSLFIWATKEKYFRKE